MKVVKFAGAAGLALMLAACGGQEEEPTETATEETPAATETVAISDGTTAPPGFTICAACHSVKPGENGIGPTLSDIYNSTAGAVPDFEFSQAMKESGLKWDDATLDAYLTDPQKVVPGTKMSFGGIKDAAQRKAVIEYLKTL